MIRSNQEIKVKVNEKLNTKYGSTDRNNPSVIYIIVNTYISPKFLSDDYSEQIKNIKKNIKKRFSNNSTFSENYYSNNITNLEIYENNICFGKKTFLHFELFLKQKKVFKLKEISNELTDICFNICNAMEKIINEEEFCCYKNKK